MHHNLGDFGPHRRDIKGVKLTPQAEWVDLGPPSRIGLTTELAPPLAIGPLQFDPWYLL